MKNTIAELRKEHTGTLFVNNGNQTYKVIGVGHTKALLQTIDAPAEMTTSPDARQWVRVDMELLKGTELWLWLIENLGRAEAFQCLEDGTIVNCSDGRTAASQFVAITHVDDVELSDEVLRELQSRHLDLEKFMHKIGPQLLRKAPMYAYNTRAVRPIVTRFFEYELPTPTTPGLFVNTSGHQWFHIKPNLTDHPHDIVSWLKAWVEPKVRTLDGIEGVEYPAEEELLTPVYRVISDQAGTAFKALVNKAIEEGYRPQGGIAAYGGERGIIYLLQAMVRDE